ncbi:glycosyltransferase [Nanoarchaeota archaeon]
MRICIICDDVFPALGGRGGTTERLGLKLAKKGHKVVFISADNKNKIKVKQPNVKVCRLPSFSVPKTNKKLRLGFPSIFRMAKIFEKEKIEVVQINAPYMLAISAIIVARSKNIPILHHIHTAPEHMTANTPWRDSKIIRTIVAKYLVFLYNLTDHAVFLTNFTRDRIKKYGLKKPSSIISNGIDLTKFNPKIDKYLFRKKFKLKNEKMILYVGRLMKEKNVDMLIDAFELLVKERPECKLAIVGDGWLKGKLEKKVADKKLNKKVIFTGNLPENMTASAYVNAYMFVLVSTLDLEPLVILEAQACGCPVISSKTEAFSAEEMIGNNKGGFLVNPLDKRDVMEKMLTLVKNEKLHDKMKKESIKISKEKEISKSILKFEKLYKQLIKNKKQNVN